MYGAYGQLGQGEKRGAQEGEWDMSVTKMHRGENGESWTCPKCNNVNYEGRTVCNMRSCKAVKPGMPEPSPAEPWICPGCGNENYATRVFCNLRKCQQARPGATFQEIQAAMQQGNARPGVKPTTKPTMMMQMNSRATEEGSWQCASCGNVNFPGRTHCNSTRCGRPREEVDAGGMGAYAAPPNFQQYGAPPNQGANNSVPPDGAWVCIACQNVNFPTRMVCNGKTCGRPRSETDGGPPTPGMPVNAPPRVHRANGAPMSPGMQPMGGGAPGGAPEGSWICPSCQNVNFPTRFTCNKRGCALPRPS